METVVIRGARLDFPKFDWTPGLNETVPEFSASGTMQITEAGRRFFAEAQRHLQESLDADGGWREVGGALLLALEENSVEADDLMMRVAP